MSVKNLKRILSSFKLPENLKEIELNSILEKISKRKSINSNEKKFLEKFESIQDDDLKSFSLLSRQTATEKINDIINNNKTIICDLEDRDGKIGQAIIDTSNDYENELTILKFKNQQVFKMKDNFLYNINYNLKKNIYTLEKSDEFYEKISSK
jgi:hypothetical protein